MWREPSLWRVFLFWAAVAAVLAIVALVLATAKAHAGGCAPVYLPSVYHAAQKYGYARQYDDRHHEKRVVILEYLPLYSVGYAEDPTKKLEQKLDALEKKLSAPAAPPMEPVKADPVAAGLAVLSSRCASCHTGAASKKGDDGKPVVLFGGPGQFSPDADLVAVLLAVEDNHMPPSKPLSAEEKKAVREMVRAARK